MSNLGLVLWCLMFRNWRPPTADFGMIRLFWSLASNMCVTVWLGEKDCWSSVNDLWRTKWAMSKQRKRLWLSLRKPLNPGMSTQQAEQEDSLVNHTICASMWAVVGFLNTTTHCQKIMWVTDYSFSAITLSFPCFLHYRDISHQKQIMPASYQTVLTNSLSWVFLDLNHWQKKKHSWQET